MELSAKESRCESLGSWVELRWDICRCRLVCAVAHRGGRVERVADVEGVLGLLDFFSGSGEATRFNFLLLHCALLGLDLLVNLRVQFTFLTKLRKHLVLICTLRGLKRQITLALLKKKQK